MTLAIYAVLALVTVVIFFSNMRPTHHVLAAARKTELRAVQAQIAATCRALSQSLAGGQATGTTPADLNALVIYEGRLKDSRTWPYNTAMFRTLILSVLVPAVPVIGRFVIEALLK